MSLHKIVHLPKKGANFFTYLDLDIFFYWFWRVYPRLLTELEVSQDYRKVFIYQRVQTFVDMLGLLSANSRCEIKSLASETTPLVIKDCKYKYHFSNYFQSNFVFSLQMTPIWLVLSVFRNELKKLASSELEAVRSSENPTTVDTAFSPMEAEYKYFCTTIDLDAIPFNTIKIES